jgi:acyl-CoA thioester hydrolase
VAGKMPTYQQVQEIRPAVAPILVTAEQTDANGHLNIRWYFDHCATGLNAVFTDLGISLEHNQHTGRGLFTLSQHLEYHAESMLGDLITARVALLHRTGKIVNGITYLANETRGTVAHSSEYLALYVDLDTRRGTNFGETTAQRMDEHLARTAALSWVPDPPGKLFAPR